MKKSTFAAIAVALASASGATLAAVTADTAQQTISLETAGGCEIVSAANITFAAKSIIAGQPPTNAVTATGNLSVLCNNTTYKLGADGGLNAVGTQRKLAFSGSTIDYTLEKTVPTPIVGIGTQDLVNQPPTGAIAIPTVSLTGPASGNQTVTMRASILAGTAIPTTVGVYTDTVTYYLELP